ncbi:hypothetical protein B0H19DRAFT_1058467 [Mycena capillaripes]|nr:hypothetical protein B0H19DRAFT_1058467 [Mycena capillaripes]
MAIIQHSASAPTGQPTLTAGSPASAQEWSPKRERTASIERSEHITNERPERMRERTVSVGRSERVIDSAEPGKEERIKDGFVVVAKGATVQTGDQQPHGPSMKPASTPLRPILRRAQNALRPKVPPVRQDTLVGLEPRYVRFRLPENHRDSGQRNMAISRGGRRSVLRAMGPPAHIELAVPDTKSMTPQAMGTPPHADVVRTPYIPPEEVYSCAPPLSGYVKRAEVDAFFKAYHEPCQKRLKRAREGDDDEGGDAKRRCYIHERQEKPMRSYTFCMINE